MTGAIFYSSKYGSTTEYAHWIGEETGLPVHDIRDPWADPTQYDFLVLGSPVIYYKLLIHKWVKKHLDQLMQKQILFFSVSGAPAGSKLDGWMTESFPPEFIEKIHHVGLRGRQIPSQLSWYDRMMLIIASKRNKDPQAAKEELEGFDYMDKSSIAPVVAKIEEMQMIEVPVS